MDLFHKKIHLRLSDLFVTLSLLCGIPVVIEGNLLMATSNPKHTNIPLWALLLSFLGFVIFFILYIHKEYKRGDFKPKNWIIVAFTLFIILQAEDIFLAPDVIAVITHSHTGALQTSVTSISGEAKLIYFLSYVYLLTGLYTGMFILPTRVDLRFIKLLCYLFYAVCLGLMIHSIIVDDYPTLFSKIFGTVEEFKHIQGFAPKSIFTNKNMFGMVIEFGMIAAVINYSLGKKRFHLVIGAIFYVQLLLTVCKSGIVASSAIIIIYSLTHFIIGIIEKKKGDIITFSIILFIIIASFITIVILYNTNIDIKEKTDFALQGDMTFTGRTFIWKRGLEILSNFNIFRGIGYGVYNSILLNSAHTWASHAWFISILCRGGLVSLIAYLSLSVYAFYIFIKCFKVNKVVAISMAFGIAIYFGHSCMEDNYMVVLILLVVLLIVKSNLYKEHLTPVEAR